MTALQVMKSEYEGHEISFNEEGWFNATQAAAKYGKRPNDWLAIHATKEYLAALKECMGISEDSSLIMARRGRNTSGNGNNSGTWMHPKLGVAFARWLDVRFAVWCDLQIDTILRGKVDQKRLRSEAASSFKVMAAVLQLTRDEQGKQTAAHHYSNEARLVNWALSGKFQSIDRDTLDAASLQLLAKLEEKNAVLLGRGMAYEDRKKILEAFALENRGVKPDGIPALAAATRSAKTP